MNFAGQCELQKQTDGGWKCLACGWVYAEDTLQPPHRNCTGEPVISEAVTRLAEETETNILDDADRWRGAVLRWEAGIPGDAEPFETRSQDEIEFIVAELCPKCHNYQAGYCGCCGAKGQDIRVKSHMATEGCPGKKW